MYDATPLPPIPTRPAGPFIVDEDIQCRTCKYNLRGLSSHGLCPECGAPVSRTVLGDRLRLFAPEWLENMATGCRLIIIGLIASVIVGCVSSSRFSIFGMAAPSGNPGSGTGIMFLVGLISFVGHWKLTSPEPAREGVATSSTARALVRLGILLALASGLLQFLAGLTRFEPDPLSQGALALIGIVAGVGWIVGEFAKYVYIRKLAERIPNLALANRARFVFRAYVVFLIAAAVIAGILLFITFFVYYRVAPAFSTTAPITGTFTNPATLPVSMPKSNPATTSIAASAPAAVPIVPPPWGFFWPMIAATAAVFFGYLIISIIAIALIARFGKALRLEAQQARINANGIPSSF